MTLFGLFVIFAWIVDSAFAQEASCFSNTTELFDFLADTADGSDEIAVILCPNTFFSVGNLNDEIGRVEGGMMPLIGFPRVQYLCGEDGASTNNCVFQGGDIQFWNPPGTAVENLSVSGVTFEGATFVALLLQGTGDITFVDCIIRDHVQAAPVVIDNYPFRRELTQGRQLQANTQSVSFQGTMFANNAQRDPPAMFTYGVITVTDIYNALIIDECEFTDNIYDEDFGPGTYVIRSFGSPVDVTDSTFCRNSVIGFGLVEIFSYEEDMVVSDNGGSVDGNLTCPFLAVSETIPELDRQVTCVGFDAGGCEEITQVPTVAPSMGETMDPTPDPTPAPTLLNSSPSPGANFSSYPTPSPSVKDSKSKSYKTKKMMMMGMQGKGKGSSPSSKGKGKSSDSLPTKGSSKSGKGSSVSKGKGSSSPMSKGMTVSKMSSSSGSGENGKGPPAMKMKRMMMMMMMKSEYHDRK